MTRTHLNLVSLINSISIKPIKGLVHYFLVSHLILIVKYLTCSNIKFLDQESRIALSF